MSKINKITIVGGGSAGWMTAAMLIKSFPEKDILVIESKNIPTVGVGESTYDGINYFLEYLEIDRKDFFQYTDASIKLGIEFCEFYKEGFDSFLYPFGLPYVGESLWGMQDWMIKKHYDKDLPLKDFAESYFPVAHLIKENSFYDNKNNDFPNFNPRINTAFHFDATKFANWLKDRYSIPRGVKHLVEDISSAEIENNKIKRLICSSGYSVESDLFIDCTGFRSLLLGEFLKEPFISYSDKLPNNSAWATQIPYDDKDKELTTVTKCTALKNGWAWNIPLYSRLGAGYVYSNKYIDKDSALNEFKKYLCSNKMDHKKSNELIDSLFFKHIDMRVGIHERVWVENVVAIGLSAAFIEPLESNGLFTTHEFLFYLVKALSRGETSSIDKDFFNRSCHDLYNSFANFIKIHYILSHRDDSNYWIENYNSNIVSELGKYSEYLSSYIYRLYEIKTKTQKFEHFGGFPTGLACISTGMNFLAPDDVSIRLAEIRDGVSYSDTLSQYFHSYEKNKKEWGEIAKNSPKLTQYLEDTYYK